MVDGPLTGELDEEQRADFAHELARQLSAAIENIQLLDEILSQRRLLEDTFNSLLDLVVVTDGELRIVQMNEAFIERTTRSRAELMDRPLETLVGPEPRPGPPPRTQRIRTPTAAGRAGSKSPSSAGSFGDDDAAHQRVGKSGGSRPGRARHHP